MLGLPLKCETPDWTEFETDGTTLALHASDEPNPEKGGQRHPPAGRCRPDFGVPNLDDFHGRMVEHRVSCIQEPTDVFDARIAQYAEPDGLVISIGEEKHGG